MTQATTTEPVPETPETMIVRYGKMGLVGEFRNASGARPLCGQAVVIQTDRGMELGQVLSLSCGQCARSVAREQVARYVASSGPESCAANAGKVLRVATAEDVGEAAHMDRSADEMKHYCQQRAGEMGLKMRVVAVEHIFGGERAVFYFTADNRVDFRSLVRELARQYQTRIEMRQIGARDEARLLADYEICGRECCCKNFLKNLKPVNMRMAKTQKATLDPTKVSGRCGRLRCCLRYENETYEELDRKLPAVNSRVRVQQGIGKVADRHILTQLLMLEMEPDGTRLAVPAEAVLEVITPRPRTAPGPGPTRPEPSDDQPTN